MLRLSCPVDPESFRAALEAKYLTDHSTTSETRRVWSDKKNSEWSEPLIFSPFDA